MTKREANRTALLVILNEIEMMIATSDEWCSDPETNEPLTKDDVTMVKTAALAWTKRLERRIPAK